MSKKKRCDFRMPPVVRFDGVPYGERWAIYCACGMTIFGNSKDEAESTWKKHADGKLRCGYKRSEGMNRLDTMVKSRYADWAETRDRKILREAITLQMLVTAIRCRHGYDLSVSVGHECWNGGEKNIRPNSFTLWHKKRNEEESE